MQPEPQDPKLISIERVVAFVLGPVVIAASGFLSAKAVQLGFNVTPAEVEASFASGGLTAGALVWKWLHGRQAAEKLKVWEAEIGRVPGASDFVHTTLADLEGLAHTAALNVAHQINGTGGSPPGVEPISPASDPAPTSGGQDAKQADAGAASVQ